MTTSIVLYLLTIMKKTNSNKIASHGENNFKDEESISLIKLLLAKHRRVMPKLDSIDKWPNIDGYIEIQSKEGIIIGRLNVQAKTLNKKDVLKFRCPVPFLSNCEIDPCLLFGVDTKNERVYWLYFDVYKLKEIDFENNTTSKTIEFIEDQYFDKQIFNCIEQWELLVKKNQERFGKYDHLKGAYSLLKKHTNPAIGDDDQKYIQIHSFLDELNSLLDGEQNIIKYRFFPSSWKIGMAIYKYTETELVYTIYPISQSTNDVQIKIVDEELHNQIQKEKLHFVGHSIENPVEIRPKEYARNIVTSMASELLEPRLLDHANNEILAREYIFAFIDRFYEPMQIKVKDEYAIEELTESIDYILESNIKIGNANLSFGLFVEFFNSIRQKNSKVKRLYKAKDFSRDTNGWIWGLFSKKDANFNLKIFFDNLIAIYNSILTHSFPQLKNELSFYGNADTILVHWNIKDEYIRNYDGPTYKMYFLKSKNKKEKFTLHILSTQDVQDMGEIDYSKPIIEYNDDLYNIISIKNSILDFIYEDTPLLTYIYQTLETKIKDSLK